MSDPTPLSSEKKVHCIWRDGCERGDSCSKAGHCLGVLSNRVEYEKRESRSGFSKETLQALEDLEHEEQP
jgi:hypothetical protein